MLDDFKTNSFKNDPNRFQIVVGTPSKKHKISEIHLLDIRCKKEKIQGLRGI